MPNLTTHSVQVGNLFREAKPLAVPRFQRDFSWDREKVEQLWSDTWNAITEGGDTYFLGSIVVKDSPAAAVAEVIDGQQRLTTLSLLLCALRDAANEYGDDKRAMQIEIHYLAAGSGAQDDEDARPKLTPNQTNRRFYEERILNKPDLNALREAARSRKEDKSNRLMANAYIFFRDGIRKEVEAGKGIAAICKDLLTAVDSRLQVIKIVVADDYDAYLLFETLNDRGLALSVADLLKNYLFSRADDRLLEVQDNWDKMQSYLQNIETKRFLRHLWLSEFGVVRDKDLFKKIREKYVDKSQAWKFSRKLRDSAESYSALHDPDSEVWTMFDPQARKSIAKNIQVLNLFGVNQYNPLLLSALSNSPDIFSDVLNIVVIFAFRYSIIGSGGTGNIERAFTEAALHLKANPGATAADVFAKVSHLYPTDEQFESDFGATSITQSSIARYILRTINDTLDEKGQIVDPDTYVVNLEHVLPKKFKEEEWESFKAGDDIEIAEYVDRLGNMTLLKVGLNSQSSNKSFAVKKTKYLEHSPLKVAEYVYSKSDWTYKNVEENQALLAKEASTIWRL